MMLFSWMWGHNIQDSFCHHTDRKTEYVRVLQQWSRSVLQLHTWLYVRLAASSPFCPQLYCSKNRGWRGALLGWLYKPNSRITNLLLLLILSFQRKIIYSKATQHESSRKGYHPATMYMWTLYGFNVGYMGTEWTWTGKIVQVPHGFSNMGPTFEAHMGWLYEPHKECKWAKQAWAYTGQIVWAPYCFRNMGPTCEAHVGWLNGLHLRPILIPLRPHMGKHMGLTWVSPSGNCGQTHLGPIFAAKR